MNTQNTTTTFEADHLNDPQESHREAVLRNGLPIGPGSLTWKHFGHAKLLFLTFRVGLLQNMHPVVSKALEDHSQEVFFANPWNRLLRSLPPIMGAIFDEDPEATGERVRNFHKNISGKLHTGERYHALNPDVYYWTHATFFESMITGEEYFGTPMTEEEKEQLYRESITWYDRYSVNMRPVHKDYASFKVYWEEMLNNLKPTPVTDFALSIKRTPCPFPQIPKALWWLIDPIMNKMSLWLARGTMPPAPRAALGWEWSEADERRLRLFSKVVMTPMKLVPKNWQYLGVARRGRKRAEKMQLKTSRT